MIKNPDSSLSVLAWCCAILPFLTIHICYLVSASYGHVEWCVPHWDACTSISATGRQMPEKLLFKLGMIPSALLTAWLWWRIRQWLLTRLPGTTLSSTLVPGLLAASFLILYTLALGVEGDTYQRIRRIGVTLSFAFTFLAQLQCTRLFGKLARASNASQSIIDWQKYLFWLLSCLLLTGLTSVILDAWMGTGYDSLEDAFEWNMALMLQFWFAGTAVFLSKTTGALRLSHDSGMAH